MSLSEMMNAFEYLGKVAAYESDRLDRYPWASLSVKIITFDEWLSSIEDGGEFDAR